MQKNAAYMIVLTAIVVFSLSMLYVRMHPKNESLSSRQTNLSTDSQENLQPNRLFRDHKTEMSHRAYEGSGNTSAPAGNSFSSRAAMEAGSIRSSETRSADDTDTNTAGADEESVAKAKGSKIEPVLPANALPTDLEIEESIRAQNQRERMVDKLMKDRVKRAQEVKRQVDAMSQEELSPAIPQMMNPSTETPPEDVVALVRSRARTVH